MSDPTPGNGAPVGGNTLRRRVVALSARRREWADRHDPSSATGVAVGALKRYQAVDGPLQTALLSLYILVGVVPALLVMEEYLNTNPAALANRIVRHYDLSSVTASQVRTVLVDSQTHELGSALLAIAGALVFGVGFGRVLQLVHARAWQITVPHRETDRARYAAVLLGLYLLIVLLLTQLDELGTRGLWVDLSSIPVWISLLILFFTWSPRFLTHNQLAWRDLLPSAVLTAIGLVAVMFISSLIMQRWVDFYAQDYGGFGVIMAIFFWIEFSAGIIVAAASLSPPLAHRRSLRRHP
jgi:membrane protein